MYIYLLTYLLADADVTQLSIWVVSSLCMEFATTSLQQPHESEQICQQRSWVALCPWRERTCWSSWASSEFSTHCGHRRNATWQLSLVGVGGATLISAKPVMKLSALFILLCWSLICLVLHVRNPWVNIPCSLKSDFDLNCRKLWICTGNLLRYFKTIICIMTVVVCDLALHTISPLCLYIWKCHGKCYFGERERRRERKRLAIRSWQRELELKTFTRTRSELKKLKRLHPCSL